MGPRFNGVEDAVNRLPSSREKQMLQWGHALMAWKTAFNLRPRHRAGDASMGPRFNGVEDETTKVASAVATPLQWGHALMAWKTSLARCNRVANWRLQWGHALMAWKTIDFERSIHDED